MNSNVKSDANPHGNAVTAGVGKIKFLECPVLMNGDSLLTLVSPNRHTMLL